MKKLFIFLFLVLLFSGQAVAESTAESRQSTGLSMGLFSLFCCGSVFLIAVIISLFGMKRELLLQNMLLKLETLLNIFIFSCMLFYLMLVSYELIPAFLGFLEYMILYEFIFLSAILALNIKTKGKLIAFSDDFILPFNILLRKWKRHVFIISLISAIMFGFILKPDLLSIESLVSVLLIMIQCTLIFLKHKYFNRNVTYESLQIPLYVSLIGVTFLVGSIPAFIMRLVADPTMPWLSNVAGMIFGIFGLILFALMMFPFIKVAEFITIILFKGNPRIGNTNVSDFVTAGFFFLFMMTMGYAAFGLMSADYSVDIKMRVMVAFYFAYMGVFISFPQLIRR